MMSSSSSGYFPHHRSTSTRTSALSASRPLTSRSASRAAIASPLNSLPSVVNRLISSTTSPVYGGSSSVTTNGNGAVPTFSSYVSSANNSLKESEARITGRRHARNEARSQRLREQMESRKERHHQHLNISPVNSHAGAYSSAGRRLSVPEGPSDPARSDEVVSTRHTSRADVRSAAHAEKKSVVNDKENHVADVVATVPSRAPTGKQSSPASDQRQIRSGAADAVTDNGGDRGEPVVEQSEGGSALSESGGEASAEDGSAVERLQTKEMNRLSRECVALQYQLDWLRSCNEQVAEYTCLLQQELKTKNRTLTLVQQDYSQSQRAVQLLQAQLEEQSRLVAEHGLILLKSETEKGFSYRLIQSVTSTEKGRTAEDVDEFHTSQAKESTHSDQNQTNTNESSADDEEEETASQDCDSTNGEADSASAARDSRTERQVDEYKFKLAQSQQLISTLQSQVGRLESQVERFRDAAEHSEQLENRLKREHHKTCRELRDALSRIEELESQNGHLEARLAKLNNVKSSLLKDL